MDEINICTQRNFEDTEDICCSSCSVKHVCLAEELSKYRAMLLKLQFVENCGRTGGAIYTFCPICGNANIQGHKDDCELASLLRSKEENAEFIKAQAE